MSLGQIITEGFGPGGELGLLPTVGYAVTQSSRTPTIALTLTDLNNVALPNLTGLTMLWWDNPNMASQGAPTLISTGVSTDSSGLVSVTSLTGSTLPVGGIGWAEISDSDWNPANNATKYVAAGPVQVA